MSMLKAVWEAITRLLADLRRADPITVVVGHVAEEVATPAPAPAPAPVKVRAPRKRAQKPAELASMGDLLSSLEHTFDSLRLPFGSMSWISRSHVIGLRKLGVHVVHPTHVPLGKLTDRTVPPSRILPAMLAVSYGWSRSDTEAQVQTATTFAIKQTTLPAGVSPCQGQHYLFGCGYRLGAKSEVDPNKALHWVAGYITVRSDGSLYLHSEIKPRRHNIPVSRPSSRRSNGRQMTYTTKEWGTASLASLYQNDGRTADDGALICTSEFATAMNWWLKREENWSVSVKKEGERVTFAIPKGLTAAFFKDRIKVTNAAGATRRIIHHVREHERDTSAGATTVKEHIRGLSDFDWKGYQCHVTAPRFNGSLSNVFTLAGTETENDAPTQGWVDVSKVGKMLADFEDGQRAA